jgi:dihydrodipicolinate synthase/N-acetylneuraminate lyase
MKSTAVTAADLARSVVAVPPLARHADLTLNREANSVLIHYLEAAGVSALMYGGNANFYNIGLYEYAETLDMLAELAAPESWVIPSVGPDFGKMIDQLGVLRERSFPCAMVLPLGAPTTPDGVENGLRRFADRLGRPIIVYVRTETYLTPANLRRLVEDRLVAAVKYAIVRGDPSNDDFLSELVQCIDRKLIVSGIGERPAVAHLRDFALSGFTSGSACLAPRRSQALLQALKRRDYADAEALRSAFLPLEDCRDRLNPIRVLHEAVTLADIAPMGPLLPLLSNLEAEHHPAVRKAARDLLAFELRSMAPAN